MAVAEHGLEGQLLVKCEADGERHFARLGVADENDGRALVHHFDGLTGGELGACGFDDQIAAQAVGQVENGLHGVLILAVDHAVRAELERLVQTRLHDVHHVNVGNTLSLERHHAHQTDAARAHDNGGLTGVRAALIGRVEADRERLDERAFERAYVVRQLEAERGFMRDILLKNAVHRGSREKYNIRTEVVFALAAEFAVAAGLARFERNAVADLEVRNLLANLNDRAARLVTQNERRLDHIMTDGAGFVIVHIAAADADIFELYQHLIVLRRLNIARGVTHFADAVHDCYFHFAFHKNPSALLCIFTFINYL